MKQKVQKPHKWNRRKDADLCIACEKPFKRGDLCFTDVAVNVHVGCLRLYIIQCQGLGMSAPKIIKAGSVTDE